MYDTGLADRLRARGVRVVEVAGWRTRGSSTFSPRGSVNHHTAGAATGATPSLTICTYGRSDLPGPLCHVLLGRNLVAYVIAAGRANHAGAGGWRGLTGNSTVHGLEIEHTGTGPSADQLRVAVKIHAAFLEAPGQSHDPRLACQHFEWAPTRKIDFRELAPPYTTDSFRAAIAAELSQEDDMQLDADDQKFIRDEVRSAALTFAQWLTAGRNSTIFDPARQTWMAGAVTLPRLAAVTGVNAAEVASLVLAGLDPSAIAAAIPDNIAEDVADELYDRLGA